MQCVGLGAVKLFRALAKVVARDICGSAEVIWTHVDNIFALVRCSWGDTYVEAKLRLSRAAGSDEVYRVSLRMRRWVGGKVAQSIRNLTAYTITVKRSGDRCLAESRRTDEYDVVIKSRAYVLSSTLVGADPIAKVIMVLPVAIPVLVLKQVLARVSSI